MLTALKDVETALVAYAKQQETHKSLSEAVVNNRKAVDLAMQLYLAGRSDFLNVLIAQRTSSPAKMPWRGVPAPWIPT